MSANDDATARIKDLKNQLELVDATITMPSTDPAHWASIKDLPEFETLRLKSEIDLYKLKIKLMDEIHQLEINRKDEIHQMKMLHFEFLVYNTPSMDPVTANATGRKKVSDLYLLGPEEPRPASDFAATVSLPFLGVGFVTSLYDFDVSAVGTCRPRSAMWFLEGASTIAGDATFTTDNGRLMTVKSGANKLFDILLFNNDLSKVGEMPISEASAAFQQKGSISKDFLPELGRAFFPNMFSSDDCSLNSVGCPVGLATSGSTPDGYLFGPSMSPQGKTLIRGIVEAKISTLEAHVAMRQGISEAINVAMQLLTGGVHWAEVVVPILATNGHTLQIGVEYLLYPTFPVFTFATRELRLLHADDRQEAVRALVCLQKFLQEDLPAITKAFPPTTTPAAPSS